MTRASQIISNILYIRLVLALQIRLCSIVNNYISLSLPQFPNLFLFLYIFIPCSPHISSLTFYHFEPSFFLLSSACLRVSCIKCTSSRCPPYFTRQWVNSIYFAQYFKNQKSNWKVGSEGSGKVTKGSSCS